MSHEEIEELLNPSKQLGRLYPSVVDDMTTAIRQLLSENERLKGLVIDSACQCEAIVASTELIRANANKAVSDE